MEKKRFSRFLSGGYLAVVLAFVYLPIIYMVVFSFNDSKSMLNFTGFSLRWYESISKDRFMLESISNTFIVAIISTAVSTVLGTVTAIGLSKSRKLVREVVLEVNNLPIMNPDIVTAIGLMLLFTSVKIPAGMPTLILAHVSFCTPFVILSIMPKLRQLDDNVAEAAMDLGATPFQALIEIILPQIYPAILSGALIAFSMSLDDFVVSYFTKGEGLNTISTYVYTMKRYNYSVNALSTIIMAVVAVVLILVNLIPRLTEKKRQQGGRMNMKKSLKILSLILAAVLCLLLTGCQKEEAKPAADATEAPKAEAGTEAVSFAGQTLNVYNWGEYIDMNVIYNFEKEYDVKVNYDRYSSNEEMYTKLATGATYDILIPSDYMIERLIREKQLQKIDKSVVTNLNLLYEGVTGLDFDPDNTWSVPYLWQNVGIVYDTTKISREKMEEKGFSIFLDPEYDGHAYMYDSERDAFMVAFKALGYSANTENDEEITAAYNWLREMDKAIHPSYVTDEVIDSMATGKKWLALVYSGDAAFVLSENENMGFCAPKEGTNICVDAMVIPANAKNPALANVFINYILAYENSLMISEEVGYASPNAQVLAELSGEGGSYEGNEAYLPRTGYEKDEFFHDNETLKKKLAELWIKVKLHE